MEQLQALWQIVEKQMRVVVFVAMGLLLGVVFFLRNSESSTYVPRGSDKPGGDDMKSATADEETMQAINKAMSSNLEPLQESPFASLVVSSMFDVKAVLNATQQEALATEKYEIALALRQQKKYREALRACKECLAIRPSHIGARRLKAELEEELERAGMRVKVSDE